MLRWLKYVITAALPVFLLACAALRANESSEPARLAPQSLLLAVARAGDTIVAVGDRGHVLRSTDEGRSWAQVLVPSRAMLTSVSFPDARNGWAAGHDGVILVTSDGGLTWTRLDSGHDLETVYFDVLFLDAKRGFAVGAYGKFLATADGGRTWNASHPSPDDVHYNRIARAPGGALYLAGETGLLLVSHDEGRSWSKLDVPYDGSLFGVLPLSDQRLVVYGLRGNILTSADGGQNWTSSTGEVKTLVMGGRSLPDGRAVLAGMGGNFFIAAAGSERFQPWKPTGFGTSVSDFIIATDGALVVVGEAGASRLPLP